MFYNTKITEKEIQDFKNKLLEAMKNEGATEEDFSMFDDDLYRDIIITAINCKRAPEDVAWALLQ
jgi:hypothetical protein